MSKDLVMINRKTAIQYVLSFVAIVYTISAIGYFFWLCAENGESIAAMLPIIAPVCGAVILFFLSKKQINLKIKKFSGKGVLIGFLIPTVY